MIGLILYTKNIEETISFYQKLDFAIENQNSFTRIKFEGNELMFSLPNTHIPFEEPKLTGSIYFNINNIDEAWEKWKNQVEIIYPIESFPYGMKEFAFYDNNGYILQFGEEIKSEKTVGITGIGGVFFKSKNQKELMQWYTDKLGFNLDEYGTCFVTRSVSKPGELTHLQWSIFKEESTYFEPCKERFMLNYRVNNLEKFIEMLKSNKVEFVSELEVFDYGKFIHILDLDGNKIELWEPIESHFSEIVNAKMCD